MQQLFYADEVRPPEEIPVDDAEVKEPELQLALQLIAQTASVDGFHPERYRDAVKQRMEAAIERKVAGQEIQVASPEPQAQVIDLMEALKKSIGSRPPPASSESSSSPAPVRRTAAGGGKGAPRARREASSKGSLRR